MLSTKIELTNVERSKGLTPEQVQKGEKRVRAYEAPKLLVVGKAVELVQGRSGGRFQDGRYYYNY
jgi:hypothetical protein